MTLLAAGGLKFIMPVKGDFRVMAAKQLPGFAATACAFTDPATNGATSAFKAFESLSAAVSKWGTC